MKNGCVSDREENERKYLGIYTKKNVDVSLFFSCSIYRCTHLYHSFRKLEPVLLPVYIYPIFIFLCCRRMSNESRLQRMTVKLIIYISHDASRKPSFYTSLF